MLIRRETPGDVDSVRAVVAAAFAPTQAVPGHGGADGPPVEVRLLDELRADPGWLPELSLVAPAPGGGIAGHVVCTRAHVDAVPVLGLGTLAVHPDHQRRGVGSALVHAVLGAAEALGEPLVALLGDPAYYSRFGFEHSRTYGVTAPEPQWGKYFQVRVFGRPVPPPRGRFSYAAPFSRVDGG
ncbi:GNAT family N-acetyltransferase [Microbispora sp. H11081]|uniref:GNAT family N-acetyltransferase n=1 Tax=Microbispora sp. H11081 TaxID=2729107 RepID=UPI0014749782|nr:N-acetyltransferase [Microbispora sp. H11081]